MINIQRMVSCSHDNILASVRPGAHPASLPCLALLALLLFASLAGTARAETYGDLTYATSNSCVTITGYKGAGGNVIIPPSIQNLPVSIIGATAFRFCSSITNVVIPDSITNIGESAFYECDGLTSVYIPNNVTTIRTWAFRGCSALTNIVIPASVTTLEEGAFDECRQLTMIAVDEHNPAYVNVDGVLFDKNLTTLLRYARARTYTTYSIPSGVTRIASSAFSECSGLANVTLPDSVETLGKEAFKRCFLMESIVIPRGVSFIEGSAFQSCSGLKNFNVATNNTTYSALDGVLFNKDQTTLVRYPLGRDGGYAIPAGVASIAPDAFSWCTRVSTVTLPPDITTVGDRAFQYCVKLGDITLPEGVASIGNQAFMNCRALSDIILPNAVTNLGESAFFDCGKLTRIVLPNSIMTLNEFTFCECTNLTNVTLSTHINNIGDYAFWNCVALTTVNIPATVTNIGNSAFRNCGSLTNVFIPDSVARIGTSAFSVCSNLASITIPSSVAEIANYAFYKCTGLTSVFYKGNAPYLVDASFVFFHADNVTHYYVPGTTGWGNTYGTRPTAPWLPQLEPSALGTQTNGFGFDVHWASGRSVVVEACTNLASPVWIPVGTNTLSEDTVRISDPDWAQYPGRFYRLQAR